MGEKETFITKLEKGRAEFAYRCVAESLLNLKPFDLEGKRFLESAVRDIKDVIRGKMEEEVKKGIIKRERIDELLNSPSEYLKKDKEQNLSDVEKKVIKHYKDLIDNYKSYVRKISSMILSNGLGQTLAFVKAKSQRGNAYDLIYKQLTEYMKSNHTTRISMPQDKNELVEWVISRNSQDYRYITQEIVAFLQWLKRFAEGLIEEEGA
ncbi:MAG: type III-B CRISPR module-associated protein Cmr5 [Caldisericum sp.]